MSNFSDRLKELRKEKHLSQDELGDILRIKRATIASWESRGRYPELAAVLKLAHYFGVSLDYLLGLTGVRNPEKTHETTQKIYEAVQRNSELMEFINRLIQRDDLKTICLLLSDLPPNVIIRWHKIIKAAEEES